VPIDAIFLDTNCLFSEHWAAPSVALAQALGLASASGVPVLIPELVIMEALHIFTKEFGDSISKVRNIHSHKIAAKLADGTIPTLTLPDIQTLTDEYQKQTAATMKHYGIAVVPLPELSLSEAVTQSAKHDIPFRDTDIGFRDSLIMMSCAEYVEGTESQNAVLVTNDDGMKTASSYLSKHNITIIPTASELGNKLKLQLTEEIGRRFRERLDEVSSALKERLTEISEFIVASLEIPERLDGVLEAVVEVKQIVVEDVTTVLTDFTPAPVGSGGTIGGAEVRATILATTQPNYLTDALLHPGSDRPNTLRDLAPVEREIEATVTLNFVVRRAIDGKLEFEFTKAELGTLDDALTRVIARNSMRAAIEKPKVGGRLPRIG
jgi:predicted nucleic acid-binding protein